MSNINDLKKFHNQGIKDGEINQPSQNEAEVTGGELDLIINQKAHWPDFYLKASASRR